MGASLRSASAAPLSKMPARSSSSRCASRPGTPSSRPTRRTRRVSRSIAPICASLSLGACHPASRSGSTCASPRSCRAYRCARAAWAISSSPGSGSPSSPSSSPTVASPIFLSNDSRSSTPTSALRRQHRRARKLRRRRDRQEGREPQPKRGVGSIATCRRACTTSHSPPGPISSSSCASIVV
jgi:hypothetical protein